MKGIVTLCLFGTFLSAAAQESEFKSVAAAVQLDSVVVVAQKAGFSVSDFIGLVQSDDSFYKAFKNLRSMSYRFDVDMSFQDRKDREKAAYSARQIQWYEAPCRWMEVLSFETAGNFFRKRKNPSSRYYTARLYERLFCTEGRVCSESGPEESANLDPESTKMEGHVEELKRLIFSPGRKARVPFIGNKTAIFSQRMLDYYDFHITSENYQGTECYAFRANVKPDYQEKQGKTVIKELSTWFRKADFQVMGRTYQLSHRTIVYRFDVEMDIKLTKIGTTYYPEIIKYDGFWNVPFKKYEKGNFTVRFFDFGLQKTD